MPIASAKSGRAEPEPKAETHPASAVRHLQQWIDSITFSLLLKQAPFNKRTNSNLSPPPEAASIAPKRTGHNKLLLFADVSEEHGRLHRPELLRRRYEGRRLHVKAKTIAAKPAACPDQHGIQAAAGRQRRPSRETSTSKSGRRSPTRQKKAKWPEFKTCKSSPPRPSCPTASTRANCGRFALSQPARFTIPRSRRRKPMPTSRRNRRSAAARSKRLANATGIREFCNRSCPPFPFG